MNKVDAAGVQILVPSNLLPFTDLVAYLDFITIMLKAIFLCFMRSFRKPVNKRYPFTGF